MVAKMLLSVDADEVTKLSLVAWSPELAVVYKSLLAKLMELARTEVEGVDEVTKMLLGAWAG
ncbi:hypothetical protein PC117_g5089 [Phytophthora cactorum]|uniref:Uncharacterized protein n=1 Tax=Phytophthora cactorum TaxID=29920 RepID=A0A8T1E7C8_9STRA|nr:hypothetical protein PC117_g5089 [Phytophthora cactorum]